MIEIEQTKDLINQIWNDKQGRLVGVEPISALYLTIDQPAPSLNAITKLVLNELSNQENSPLMWAMTWGMVVVGVSPNPELNCQMNDLKDDRNRQIVKLETTKLIDPKELIKGLPNVQGIGEIILNSTPTTIEALLITYIHLIDQLIWVKYRSKLGDNNEDAILYQQVVNEVKQSGFKVTVAEADEILKIKQDNPEVAVRLYGSKINKQVQDIMGVVRLTNTEGEEGTFIDQLPDPQLANAPEITVEPTSVVSSSESIVLASVTFGKELHSGHMLLLSVADLLRRGLDSNRPMTLINNNTGPRPAGMLVNLAAQNGFSVEQAAQMLATSELPCDKITTAYRARIESGEQFNQAFDLLDSGKFDIFSSLARRVKNRLNIGGFNTVILPESAGLSVKDKLLLSVNPEWFGTGFNFARDERGVIVVEKSGRLSATGKCLSSLMQAARSTVLAKKPALIAFVDSSGDTVDACRAFNKLNLSARATQVPGAGISFDGKIASGSNGEALTLSDLLDILSDEFSTDNLALSLRHLILTRPFVVDNAVSPDISRSLYDFKDNRSFIRELVRCKTEAVEFTKQVMVDLGTLRSKVDSQTVVEPKLTKWLEFLERRTSDLLASAPESIISGMNKLKPVAVSGEFKRLESGLLKFMSRPNPKRVRRIILANLLEGEKNLSEIIPSIDPSEIILPGSFVGGNPVIKCEILEAVMKQGYQDEGAINKTQNYLQGPSGLVIRDNKFMGVLKGLVERVDGFQTISEHDFSLMETSIRFSLERMGYGTN